MNPIRFTIPIIPTAQMRSRSRAVPLKNKATGKPILNKKGQPMYTASQHKDPEQARHEEQLMQILERHAPAVPLSGALLLGVRAYLPIPESKPEWWKQAANSGYIRPTPKPDFDNFLKNITDCLTQTGFWNDDAQVVGMTAWNGKYYSVKPRWVVEIIPLWSPSTKKEWEAYIEQHSAVAREELMAV